jgi:hypothetical protein
MFSTDNFIYHFPKADDAVIREDLHRGQVRKFVCVGRRYRGELNFGYLLNSLRKEFFTERLELRKNIEVVCVVRPITVRTVRYRKVFPVRVKEWVTGQLGMLRQVFPVELMLPIPAVFLDDLEYPTISLTGKLYQAFVFVKMEKPEQMGERPYAVVA